jgi:hypothetical protein
MRSKKERSKAGEGGDKPSKSKVAAAQAAEAPDDELDVEGEGGDDGAGGPKRKLGLRGAAPWAARHAAKHAAEARARAAEPPPPGSARATIRTPTGVEEIKAQVLELHNHLEQIKALRKNLPKTFFEVGNLLRVIHDRKLYAAKGFQSFESFLEREVDLGKAVALRLARVAVVFQREAALEYGLERVLDALARLDSGSVPAQVAAKPVHPPSAPRLPTAPVTVKPPIVGRLRARAARTPPAVPRAMFPPPARRALGTAPASAGDRAPRPRGLTPEGCRPRSPGTGGRGGEGASRRFSPGSAWGWWASALRSR